jgi:hypothetical protein
MRRLISVGLATVLLLAIAAAVMGVFHGLSRSTSEASPAALTCSVKGSCSGSEVAVLRMSSTSNAHAGTFDGSSYDNVVCCVGPAGLDTDCSGVHDTVLFLSAADNAHVASYGGYPEEVCLSTETEEEVNCTYRSACKPGSACLATISGSTNAHVADCDGVDDYATKVCCYVGAAPAIGGIAEAPDTAGSAGGSSSPPYAALAGAAAGVALLAAGGWYARRRWRTG